MSRVPQTHNQAVNEQPLWEAQCLCSLGWLFGWVGGLVKCLQGYERCEGFWSQVIYSRLSFASSSISMCPSLSQTTFFLGAELVSLLPRHSGSSIYLAVVVWQSAQCELMWLLLCLAVWYSHMQTFLKAECVRTCMHACVFMRVCVCERECGSLHFNFKVWL